MRERGFTGRAARKDGFIIEERGGFIMGGSNNRDGIPWHSNIPEVETEDEETYCDCYDDGCNHCGEIDCDCEEEEDDEPSFELNLQIVTGDSAMCNNFEIANALERLASRLRANDYKLQEDTGSILDANGNKVGGWNLKNV